jgi:DNA-binding response OmpR family regulator
VTDILIVEDEKELADLLCDFLRGENYTVSVAETGEKALSLYEKYGAKLVVLDVMLPGMDGFAVCKKIREESNTPILIVSAKTGKEDKLTGLVLGADDYIEKPYDIDIMLAKIDGIFKRRYAVDELIDGDIKINKITRIVYKNDKPIEMTSKEFDLLLLLMENKGKTLSKEYLFNQIWGSDSFSEQQTLTVHIKWLREKIEDDTKKPKHILTVWGVGYKYEGI